MCRKHNAAFSLPELLIGLAILGIIAAFAIPPLFNTPSSSAASRYTAIAKDTAFMVLYSYERYKAANATVSGSTTMGALTQYMNYLNVDSSSTIDARNGAATLSCGSYACLKLANGAMLLYNSLNSFYATNTTNAVFFYIDPDGVQTDATTNGPGKSICLWLQYDGTINSWGTLPATVTTGNSASPVLYSQTVSYDPIWFQGL